MRISILGATGFIGTAIASELSIDHAVRNIRAPRLEVPNPTVDGIRSALRDVADEVATLSSQLSGSAIVINAAGLSDAGASDVPKMYGANALLPSVVRQASIAAGAERFIHISSAGVLGFSPRIGDLSTTRPFSHYTRSKSFGDQLINTPHQGMPSLILRPTSVHGVNRHVTRQLAEFARGRLSSVAGDGTNPTPQVLVQEVAQCVRFLTEVQAVPLHPILQPWSGMTTGSLLRLLGAGKEPFHLPTHLARAITTTACRVGIANSRLSAQVRRLEMVWFGQVQSSGWLESAGFRPTVVEDDWRVLAETINSTRS